MGNVIDLESTKKERALKKVFSLLCEAEEQVDDMCADLDVYSDSLSTIPDVAMAG